MSTKPSRLVIALTSDLHWGTTPPEAVKEVFLTAYTELFHMHRNCTKAVVIAGDLGRKEPADYVDCLEGIMQARQAAREAHPPNVTTPDEELAVHTFLVRGNHDYWGLFNPDILPGLALDMLDEAEEACGVYNLSRKTGVVLPGGFYLTGFDGWYGNYPLYSNDEHFFPTTIAGRPWFDYMKDMELGQLNKALDSLRKVSVSHPTLRRILVTHFDYHGPTFPGDRSLGAFSGSSWHTGELMSLAHMWLYGHTHRPEETEPAEDMPAFFNCGSDYGKPRYKLIEVESR